MNQPPGPQPSPQSQPPQPPPGAYQRPPKEPAAVRRARHMAERQAAENARRARYGKRPLGEPRPLWQQRARWGNAGIAAGVMAVVAAVAIEYKWYAAGTVSHLNGLCSSGLGQLAQAGSRAAASGCSTAALLDHLVGWGIIAGVLAVVAGVAARISAGHLRAAGTPPAQPFPPSPQG